MSKVSIRQPVVLYAMVFMLIVAFSVVTLASLAMVNASRRAYRRAVLQELKAISKSAPPDALPGMLAARPLDLELEVGIVSTATPAFGLSVQDARRAAEEPSLKSPVVAVPISYGADQRYLVGRFTSSVPLSIAFVEITRMIPIVLIGALACAALLAFMISRLVLPPLTALSEIARDVRADSGGTLEPSDAPNEIAEVARNFRHTIRLLNEERQRIEAQRDELERMQASLVRASKLASVGRLAAGIAHEIGNPLAAVQGYLSLMKTGLDDAERDEVQQRCLKELGRINDTIKKLLTYAREGEEATEETTPFVLGKVVEEAIGLVRGHPALREVKIDNRIPTREEAAALGHEGRLNQVLVNLLLNAAHAVEGREDRRIILTLEEHPDRLVLFVSDTGPGIDEANREQIFDPFFTTKAPGEGTGLGLAISRSLMEAMDGDLEVVDSAEGGATFAIRLARAEGKDLS